jgi:hypothetical protein
MRYMLAAATLAALAALTLGAVAFRAPGGEGSFGVDGAISYRAYPVTPAPGHRRALQSVFNRTHAPAAPLPRHLREATHTGVLWALATFTLADGSVVVERFSRRSGAGWQARGATSARCPAVPSEVRSAWHLTAC